VYLVIALGAAKLTFTSSTDAVGAFPWLLSVGALRMAVNAGYQSGFGVGESPFINVTLDNNKRQLVRLINRPLRQRAEVFNDDGSQFFAGLISNIEYGRIISMEIAA
jgi:hypothetical protein